MVKGHSRQVIVVHSPDQRLFEQAIFILRDGAVGADGITDEALLREARLLITAKKSAHGKWLNCGPVWAAAGAALAWFVGGIV